MSDSGIAAANERDIYKCQQTDILSATPEQCSEEQSCEFTLSVNDSAGISLPTEPTIPGMQIAIARTFKCARLDIEDASVSTLIKNARRCSSLELRSALLKNYPVFPAA